MRKKKKRNQRYRQVCEEVGGILFDEDFFRRSCSSKTSYETEWQAKFAADEALELRGIKLNWYKCQFCKKWHLTSRED